MNRKFSAYQKTRTSTQVGGTYADSRVYSTLFRRNECPLDLGLMDIEVFSKQVNGQLLNKPMTFRAGKNQVELIAQNGGKVSWSLGLQGIVRARIVDVDTNLGSYPGKSGTKFRIALNLPYYAEPVLLKTETTDAPRLRVLGYPSTESVDKHWYEVELQTGSMTDYCPVADLQIGKTVKDDSTSVASEMNQKYGGIEFGSTSDYGAHISYFGRKFEVTDRAIRMDIDAMKGKTAFGGTKTTDGTFLPSIIGTQYAIAPSGLKDSDTRILKEGKLLSTLEMMLRDKLFMDREQDMYHGKTQVSFDPDTSYQRTNGSGWFETAKEGNYSTHDGQNVTLADIVNKIQALKFNVDDPKGSVVEIETGTSGMMLVNHLIGIEVAALPFTLSTNYFIDEVPSNFTNNGLAAGHQFVEFRNFGRIFRFVWNPNKDNLDMFPQTDPETGRPLESESLDVFDLGTSNDALGNKNNIGLAYEPGAFSWFSVSNVYNFATGAIQDGSNAYSDSKEAKVRMELNGSMIAFDISRTLRLARV